MASPVTERLFSGAIAGGQQLGSEASSQDPTNWTNVGIATAFGMLMPRPNVIGQRLLGVGETAAARLGAGRATATVAESSHNPTVAEAMDAGVFQPEAVFHGDEVANPTINQSAADARSLELSLSERGPTPEVRDVARRMAPEVFSRVDELTTQRDEFRRQLSDLKNPPQEQIDALDAQKAELEKQIPSEGEYQGGKENRRLRANIRDLDRQAKELRDRQAAWANGSAEETPEMATIRAHLTAADEELRDLGPQMSAAYRMAADRTGAETVEPVPHAPEVTAAPAAGPPAPEGETPIERLLRTRVEDLQRSPPPEQPIAAPIPTLLEDARNQFMDAGRPPEEAEAVARIESAYYNTLAQDFGTTPEALYASEKVPVGRNTKRQGGGLFHVDDAGRTITLFRDADASTLVHEKAHEYLDRMLRMAERDDAPADFKGRAQKALEWMGLKSADELDYDSLTSRKDKERATKAEEKFAKGFEQYLREGVAPSRELASVFGRFKQWLTSLYKTIKGLGAPIDDDIKSVFDRMLSSSPERTVVAPEQSSFPRTLADLHELDRHQTEPAEAAPAADRVVAETTRATDELPQEIRNEIEAEIQRQQPAPESGGQGGPRENAGADVSGRGEEPEPVVGGPPGGVELGAQLGGGERPVREGAGLSGPERSGRRNGPDAKSAAPTPSAFLDPAKSPFVDEFGNIRFENITSKQDLLAAARAVVAMNPQMVQQGRATVGELRAMAEAIGEEWATLDHDAFENRLADLFGSQEAIRVGIQSLRESWNRQGARIVDAWKQANATGSAEDQLKVKMEMDRGELILSTLSKATAESGRTLGMSFRKLPNAEGTAAAVEEMLKTATGRDLYQLKMISKLNAQYDTPAKVARALRDGQKRSYGRMLLEYWINGLISGPATHATYTVGNTLLAAHDATFETGTAALIGNLRRLMGRGGEHVQFGEVGAKLSAAARSAPAAVEAAGEAIRSGITTHLPGEEGLPTAPFQGDTGLTVAKQATNAPVTWGDVGASAFGALRGLRDGLLSTGALLKAGGVEGAPGFSLRYSPLGQIPDFEIRGVNLLPVGSVLRGPGRAIAGIHSFFRMSGYSMEINAQAYRLVKSEVENGATRPEDFDSRVAYWRQNPTEDMMDVARQGATQRTLMGQGGEFVKTLSKLTNTSFNLPGLGETQLLKFIDPFVHIASNVIDQSIVHRTPVGLLSPEIRAALSGEHGNIAQDMAMARMVVGTGLAVTFGSLAAEGYITGSAPTDPKERSNWVGLGYQPHSVRIGDTWYAMNRLGPLGMLLGLSADLYHVSHLAETGEFQKAAAELHHALTQNVLDESFMRGPAELLQAIEDPGRYGERYISNFLSSFVPFSVGMAQVARASDPYSRNARSVADAMLAKIPGFSESLHPRIDRWGQEVPARAALGGAAISAIYESRMNKDPVNLALYNLGIAPATVRRRIGNVDLDENQYETYQRYSGGLLKQNLDKIVGSEQFDQMPGNSKRLLINHVIASSHTTARTMMLMKYPELAAAVHEKMVSNRSGALKTK